MSSQVHAQSAPGVEVVGHGDSAAGTLGGAHRPVLGEGLGAFDGGSIVANGRVDVVSATVGVDSAPEGTAAAGVVCTIRLNNVVLNQGVGGPAVDSQVAIAAGVEAASVVDGSTSVSHRSAHPTLTKLGT